METLGQDVRYAARNLGKTPGFAAIAIFTLALGIGASTAIFSVIDNVMMEPFPYPDAQRFYSVQIHDSERSEPGRRGGYTGPEFLDYVDQNHVFDRVIASDQTDVLYRSGDGTERYKAGIVSPGTFEFLGMPALGLRAGSAASLCVALQSVGQGVRRRSGNLEQDVCVEWDIENTNRNYAAAVWMGRRRHVDSDKADSGGDRKSHRGGVSAAVVDAGASEAGGHSERGGSGFYGDSKAAGHDLPYRIPKEVYGADGFTDEHGGGEI